MVSSCVVMEENFTGFWLCNGCSGSIVVVVVMTVMLEVNLCGCESLAHVLVSPPPSWSACEIGYYKKFGLRQVPFEGSVLCGDLGRSVISNRCA